MRLARSAILALLLTTPSALAGQQSDTTDIRSAIATLRSHGTSSQVVALLAQEAGPRPQAQLDAVVDSLVTIASAYRAADPPNQRRLARSARSALASAAQAPRGTPYAGALEALIRIYEGAPDLRGGTLSAISRLPPRGPVLDFLVEVATTGNPGTVMHAIRHLHQDTGPTGLARLRRLYETDAIVDSGGRHQIAAIATLEGWDG